MDQNTELDPAQVSSDPLPMLAKSLEPFSGPQIMVLHGIGAGKNITKAALAAGVHRTTVHAWRQENPDFEAAFQEWKRQAQENARAGVVGMGDLALRVVKKSLQKGDVKTALEVLKSLRAFEPDAPQPTDAAEVKDERVLAAEQKRIRRDERRQKLLDRHLKNAVAQQEREDAIANVLADPAARPNALPSPEAEDLTEEQEEENKEQYMEAVRKIALTGKLDADEDDKPDA